MVARGDAFGGSSRHVLDMAAGLQEEGHEVLVLVGGTADMEVPQRLAARGVAHVCIPTMGRAIAPLRDLRSLLAIRRHVKEFAPDLVSTHSSKAGVLGRLACLGWRGPVLYTPHCWAFVDGFPHAGLYRTIERFLAPLATRLITVSDAEREFGLRHRVGRPAQTQTIYNGLGSLPERAPERATDRRPVRMVMVGRFEAQKDHPLLLHALAGLTRHEWSLTMVGDGPTQPACVDLARLLGLGSRVRFVGYQADGEQELASHDLFLLISNWEGFPRTILEAMRAGLPVIASDVGGCRESVIDGHNGLIVPKGCEVSLRGALADLLGNPDRRARMGQAGFALYAERFTFDTMFRQYRDLYRELIAQARATTKSRRPAPASPAAAEPTPAPVLESPHHKSGS